MSFILDALKKSENDRQRQTGPALFEVKVAPPKAGFPVWAIAIVVLLLINMVIVGWLLLRRSSKVDEAAAAQTSAPAVTSQQGQTPGNNNKRGVGSASAASLAPPTNSAPQGAQYNNSPRQQGYGPQGAPQDVRAPGNSQRGEPEWQAPQRGTSEGDQNEPTLGGGRGNGGRYAGTGKGAGEADGGGRSGGNGNAGANGNAGGNGNAGANGNAEGAGSVTTGMARGGNPGATGSGAEGASGNPDDYAPAQDAGTSLFKGHVKRGTASGLMLYQDLALTNGANLPELRLDMHVYDPKPQARFALINMKKVTEGQLVGDGVRVEAITPEGVVLSHNGTKFLLPRE